MRVLICDDRPTERGRLASALERRGHEAVAPERVEQAIALLRGGLSPDLVLFDRLMPQRWELQLLIEGRPELAQVALLGLKRDADAEAIAKEVEATLAGRPPVLEDKLALGRRAGEFEALAARMAGRPGLEEEAARIRRLADRSRSMAEYVRAFGFQVDEPAGLVDLRRPLNRALEIVLPEARHRARLVLALGEVPPVRAVERELAHCFFDLMMNAVQAIERGAPERNTIEISTTTDDDEGLALVTIRDSGCGIPLTLLPRIFEANFTTKPDGMGLGLYVCQLLVASLEGEIRVESEPGHGTAITLALPPATPRPTRSTTPI